MRVVDRELNESGSLRLPAALLESEPAAANSTDGIKMPGTDSGGGGDTHTERGREQRGAAALQNGDKQIRKHVVVVKRETERVRWTLAGGDNGFRSDRDMRRRRRQFHIDFP